MCRQHAHQACSIGAGRATWHLSGSHCYVSPFLQLTTGRANIATENSHDLQPSLKLLRLTSMIDGLWRPSCVRVGIFSRKCICWFGERLFSEHIALLSISILMQLYSGMLQVASSATSSAFNSEFQGPHGFGQQSAADMQTASYRTHLPRNESVLCLVPSCSRDHLQAVM